MGISEYARLVRTQIGYFGGAGYLNVQQKQEMNKEIQTIMMYEALQAGHARDPAQRIMHGRHMATLQQIAREIGAGVGKYAQYEYGYDIAHAQNTDPSISNIIRRLQRGEQI